MLFCTVENANRRLKNDMLHSAIAGDYQECTFTYFKRRWNFSVDCVERRNNILPCRDWNIQFQQIITLQDRAYSMKHINSSINFIT
jgi:hypothetical protein